MTMTYWMKRLLVAGAITVTIGGCAGQLRWIHPQGTQERWARDRYVCVQ
jgi:hypothetical protein